MVEVINGVKNIKKLNIGKGLKSSPVINKASGLQPVVNKGKIKKKTSCKRIKNIRIKKYYYIIYNERVKPNHRIIK